MTLLDYLAAAGGNPEWSLSFLQWQQAIREIEKKEVRDASEPEENRE